MRFVMMLLGLCLAATGCSLIHAKPRLHSWNQKEMVVCCEKGETQFDCRQEDWISVIQQHCSGRARAVSGSRAKEVSGARITTEPNYGYGGDTQVNIDTKTTQTQCVTYECEGEIRP